MKPNKDQAAPAGRGLMGRLRRWFGRRPESLTPAGPGLVVAQASHPGRRDYNEDRFGWFSTAHGELFIVADGLGGHHGGREAAETVLAAFRDFFEQGPDRQSPPPERVTLALDPEASEPPGRPERPAPDPETLLLQALLAADRRVFQLGEAEPALAGLGSTIVALLLRDEEAWFTHAGDSRLYLFDRAGERRLKSVAGRATPDETPFGDVWPHLGHGLRQMTHDHTLVQEMIDAGRLSPREAENHPDAHLLTQSLGGHLDPGQISVSHIDRAVGDLFLLCSDGLSGPVPPGEISRVLREPWPLQRRADQLIELALAAGGSDNVTVQLVFTA